MPFIGKQPEVGAYQLIDAITTSATATYALAVGGTAYFPASARNLIVSLNGITQAPESAYTVSGSNIVFDSALTSSDVIDYILVIGDAVDIGTPSDGTVGTAQMNYPLGNFSSTGIDDNADAVAITIDSSEQVGIGTTSPSSYYAKNLVVSAGSEGGLTIASTNTTNNNYLHFADGTSGDASYRGQIGYAHNGDQLSVSSSGSTVFNSGSSRAERLRIDSAGALQIGGTTNAGFVDFDGTSLQLNTQRNPNTGGFVNTSKAHAGITLRGVSGGSEIRFYTASADNTAGTQRMLIDSAGRVTTPSQPAFSISSYQSLDVSTTGAQTCSTSNVFSTSSQIVLNYNNGNHFNSSNGRFTAPVDGIYRFDWKAGLADHNSGYFWWYLNKNGTAIVYWQSSQGMSSGSDDIAFMAHHCYVGLSANDYVEVTYLNNYQSGTIYYPSFSGMLVG